jgi:2OG-Fe(II) oxygenase superfamily
MGQSGMIHCFQQFDSQKCSDLANDGEIVVIKNFIDMETCKNVIESAISMKIPNLSKPDWKIPNFKSIWLDDCSFDYYRLSRPEDCNIATITILYDKMKDCMIDLRSHTDTSDTEVMQSQYHLELLHYHQNGYFNKHRHERYPQLFGIILQLSKIEDNYISGGTVFYVNNRKICSNIHADQGDLIIFRYDIEHEVTPIVGKDGRWSAVLPYY